MRTFSSDMGVGALNIIERNVPFETVRSVNSDRSPYFVEWLEQANREFDSSWVLVELTKEQVLKIQLPAHKEADLPAGTVEQAVRCYRSNPQRFQCRAKIEGFLNNTSLVYLKQRPGNGLEHIDGLHRLIAACISGRKFVRAYIAGRF